MIHYEKHLKSDEYYNDLYDRFTIKSCRDLEEIDSKIRNEKLMPGHKQNILLHMSLYYKTGDRYINKQQTIQEWKERDRLYDQQYQNAIEPQNVRCKFCKEPMELFDKWLRVGIEKEPTVVEFSYRCKDCKCGKDIYDNGKIIDKIPWKCPKCSREMKMKHARKGSKIYSIDSCGFCGYKKEDVFDLNFKVEPEKVPTKEERIQYEKDRDRFCLSEEEGEKYREYLESMKKLEAIFKEIEANNKTKGEKLKIKELTVHQLETFLKKELPKQGYSKLSFSDPQMDREVQIEFRLYDKTDQVEYDSRKKLKKLLEKLLKDTNWKLMSEGVHYRLGILTGRLKAFEEKLNKFIEKNNKSIIL